MKKFKRLTVLIAVLSLVLSCLAGCGDKEDNNGGNSNNSNSSSNNNGNQKVEKEDDEIVGRWVCEIDMTDQLGLDVDDELLVEYFMDFNDKGVVRFGVEEDKFLDDLEEILENYIDKEDLSKSDIEDELGMTFEEFVEETAYDTMGTFTYQVKYSIDGDVITIDGDECDFEIDGDELTIDLGDELGEMVLEKE